MYIVFIAVSRGVVYLSLTSHTCIDKALKVVGMEICHKRWVDSKSNLSMDTEHLKLLLNEDLQVRIATWTDERIDWCNGAMDYLIA